MDSSCVWVSALFRLKSSSGKLWSFARLSYAESMLPILRIIPVGGVLLAIMILVLALSPPGGMNSALTPVALLARGPLMQLGEHPEWRQFLILSAVRRADELNRLRDLADDETGTINEMASATIPIEIGEPSSTELPVTAPREMPASIKIPEQVKKRAHRARRIKSLAKMNPAPQRDIFGTLWAAEKPKSAGSPQASEPVADRMAPN
jgi:hypothetical protein